MSRFIEHIPCDNCGSKDNRGVWDDGHEYCFGCGDKTYTKTDVRAIFTASVQQESTPKSYPEDASPFIPIQCKLWLLGCGITQEHVDTVQIEWSASQQLLCWRIFTRERNLIGWQGRTFHPDAKTKYISHGRIHEQLCEIGKDSDTIVLVEDMMSAIRLSTYKTILPLFGCTINKRLLIELKEKYDKIFIWLDADKIDQARRIGKEADMLGLRNKVLFSLLDPKNCTKLHIERLLNDGS